MALGLELGKALEGSLGNFSEGVIRKKSLVTGDEDVGESKEAGKKIVS